MKRWIPAGVAAVVLIAAVAVPGISRAGIEARMRAFADAWNDDSPDRLRAMLADDVVLLDRVPVLGAESVAAWAQERMIESTELEFVGFYERTFRDIAYHTGVWTLGSTGGATTSGLHTFVWERRADGWRLASIFMVEDPVQ